MGSSPHGVDWNNDGKLDLLVGERDGYIRLYTNTGTAASPAFDSGYARIRVGSADFNCGLTAVPEVVDWNNDGKKDLLCGNDDGKVMLLLNKGTDASPSFTNAVFLRNGSSDLSVGSYGRAAPVATDWDGDGKKDLLVGDVYGNIYFFQNKGTDLDPVFNGSTRLIAGGQTLSVGYYARFDVTDWNNDGAKDIVCGCDDGNVWLFLGSGPNQAPIAQDDVATVAEDSANNAINVLGNDSDPDGDVLTVGSVGSAGRGTSSLVGGQVRYTPFANYFGTDSLTYTARDGHGGSDTATVTVTITNVNDAPNAVDDVVRVFQDTAGNILDVLANDTDLDRDALAIVAVGAAQFGTAWVEGGQVKYTPPAGYLGPDSFSYTADDGNGAADTAKVNITVAGLDGPDLVPQVGEVALPTTLAPGDSGMIQVAVANVGTLPAAGKVTLRIYASTDEAIGGDFLLGCLANQSISLPPGQTKTYGVKVAVPCAPPEAAYHVLALLEAAAGADVRSGDNLAVWAETRQLAWVFGPGTGRRGPLTVIDGDGTAATFALKGQGMGQVTPTPDGWDLLITGTDAKSALTITTRKTATPGDDGGLALRSIRVGDPADPADRASLVSLTAKTTDLLGNLTVDGRLGKLILDDVCDGHDLSIGGELAASEITAKDCVTVAFDRVADASLDTHDLPIKSIMVTEWTDAPGSPRDLIAAAWIGSITAKGAKACPKAVPPDAGSPGDFCADIRLSGQGVLPGKPALGTVKIARDLADSTWEITGAVGKVTVAGTVRDSQLWASGRIAALTLGASEASQFAAGLKPDRFGTAFAEIRPEDFQDLLASIAAIQIKGLKTGPGEPVPRFLADSALLAPNLGAVSLVNAEAGTWDLFALPGPKDLFIKSVCLKDTAEPENPDLNWTWKPGNLIPPGGVGAINPIA